MYRNSMTKHGWMPYHSRWKRMAWLTKTLRRWGKWTPEWLGELEQNMDSQEHYNDVIMSSMASQITSLTIIYSTVYSGTDHRKHQSSASLAFVRRIHRGPVNSPRKWPVTRKMFPFDDVIMKMNIEDSMRQGGVLSVIEYATLMDEKTKTIQRRRQGITNGQRRHPSEPT